jgi:hypothetical protein
MGTSRSIAYWIGIVLAAALSSVAAGCGGEERRVSQDSVAPAVQARSLPVPATLLLVVDPSAQAHEQVFRNAIAILDEVARRPALRLIVVWATNSIDQGGFDRPLIVSQSPSPKQAPTLPVHPDCSQYDTYARALCETPFETALERSTSWWSRLDGSVNQWADRQIDTLNRIEGGDKRLPLPDDGSGRRLGYLFSRVRALVDTDPTEHACVAVLGGLLVRDPPSLREGLTADTTVLSFGWRGGSERIQGEWRQELAPADVEFTPVELSELEVVGSVRSCIEGKH